MKRKILVSVIILTVLSFCCNDLIGQLPNDLPSSKNDGTRLTFYYQDPEILLYTKKSTKKIPLPIRDIYSYSDPVLSKSKEKLYITASSKDSVNDCWKYSILKLDLNGKIEDTIYIAPKCVDITYFSVSPNDSLVLITEFNHFDWIACTSGSKENRGEKSFEHLIYKISTRSVVETVSFSGLLVLDRLRGSMWSPDSKKLLISKRPMKTNCDTYREEAPQEIYVYDLVSKSKQIITCGAKFSWSPKLENTICYTNQSDVYLYNVDTKEENKFISFPNHSIRNLMWAPDGTTLLIQHCKILRREKIVTGDHAERHYYTLINSISKKKKTNRGYYDILTWQ